MKKRIILLVSIMGVLLIVGGIIYFINKDDTSNTTESRDKKKNKTVKNSYFVLETYLGNMLFEVNSEGIVKKQVSLWHDGDVEVLNISLNEQLSRLYGSSGKRSVIVAMINGGNETYLNEIINYLENNGITVEKMNITKDGEKEYLGLIEKYFDGDSLKGSTTSDNDKQITYKSNGQVNYEVCLLENTDFLGCVPANLTYVTSLIDYISLDFRQEFNFSEEIVGNIEYYIESVLIIKERDSSNTPLYNNSKKLLEQKKVPASKNVNINESVKIDYIDYMSFVKSFLSNYNISCEANLSLTLHAKYVGEDNVILDIKKQVDIPIATSGTVSITVK